MITSKNWVANLLDQVPEFQQNYAEHIRRYGELLSDVLVGELSDFASEAYVKADMSTAKRIIDFVNAAALSQDDELQGMIQVSFLMHLPRLTGYEAMRALLNEQALAMLEAEMRGEVS